MHQNIVVVGGFYGPFWCTPFLYRPYWAWPYWYVPWYYPPWYYRPPPPWWAPPPPLARPGVVVVAGGAGGGDVPLAAATTSELYPILVLDVARARLMTRLRPVEDRSDGVYADTVVLDETDAEGQPVKRAVSFRAWEGPLLWDDRHAQPERLWLGRRPDDFRSLAATLVTFYVHDAPSWRAAQRWAERACKLLEEEQQRAHQQQGARSGGGGGAGGAPVGAVALIGIVVKDKPREVDAEQAALWAAGKGFLLIELPEAAARASKNAAPPPISPGPRPLAPSRPSRPGHLARVEEATWPSAIRPDEALAR